MLFKQGYSDLVKIHYWFEKLYVIVFLFNIKAKVKKIDF